MWGPQCTCNVLSPLSHGNIISAFCFLMLIPTNFYSFHTILPQELFFTFSGRAEQIFNCEIQNPGNFFSSGNFSVTTLQLAFAVCDKRGKEKFLMFLKKILVIGLIGYYWGDTKNSRNLKKKGPKRQLFWLLWLFCFSTLPYHQRVGRLDPSWLPQVPLGAPWTPGCP